MSFQTKENTLSELTLDHLHREGKAIANSYYYSPNGEAFIGTPEGRLNRIRNSKELGYTPTSDNEGNSVQEAIQIAQNNPITPTPSILAPLATTTRVGLVKLSYNPRSASNPIAVTTNDPRLILYPIIFGRR